MKVLILGFDGMEFTLVRKWKLKNLQQKKFSKLKIPKECFKKTTDPLGNIIYEPWTPFVWSSIVTGRLPAEIGLSEKNMQRWQHPLIQLLRFCSLKLGLKERRLTKLVFYGKGKKLEKAGFQKNFFNLMQDSKVPTIFHYAKNPVSINVPLVHQTRDLPRQLDWDLKLKGKDIDGMVKATWRDFHKIRKRTLEAIEKPNWNLLMSYVRLLDTIGELQYGSFLKMHKAYMACNKYCREAKQLIKENTICLIISDHGMQPLGNTRYGMHSNHAFYSLNVETQWTATAITDFYDKILAWLDA